MVNFMMVVNSMKITMKISGNWNIERVRVSNAIE